MMRAYRSPLHYEGLHDMRITHAYTHGKSTNTFALVIFPSFPSYG